MFERFTDEARLAVVKAQEIARRMGAKRISDTHLLCAAADGPVGLSLLAMASSDSDLLNNALQEEASASQREGHLPFTSMTKKLIGQSLRETLQLNHAVISTGHLVLAASALPNKAASRQALETSGTDKQVLTRALARFDFLQSKDASTGEVIYPALMEIVDDTETTRRLFGAWLEWATFQKSDLRRAVGIFDDARSQLGDDAFPWQSFLMAELTGDVAAIIASYEEAAEAQPELAPEIHASAGWAFTLNGQHRRAEAALAAGFAACDPPSATTLLEASRIAIWHRQTDRAGDYLRLARLADKGQHRSISWLSDLVASELDAEATDQLREIVAASPKTVWEQLLHGLARVEVTRADQEPERAVEKLDGIAAEYAPMHLQDVVLSALIAKAELMRSDRSDEALADAIALAKELGRRAVAERIAGEPGET